MCWVQVALSGDVQIDQVALKNCVCTSVEHRNKDAGNDVGESKDDKKWQEYSIDIVCPSDDEEAEDGSHDSDHDSCDEHEDSTNRVDEGEFGGILEDEDESVERRGAEVLVRNGKVDEGVLVDEPHKSVETVQAASDAAK